MVVGRLNRPAARLDRRGDALELNARPAVDAVRALLLGDRQVLVGKHRDVIVRWMVFARHVDGAGVLE